MAVVDWRWDEFKNQDQSVLIAGEAITVPASGDPYVRLAEIPRQEDPSTVNVYATGSKLTQLSSDGTYVYQGNPGTDYSPSSIMAIGRDDAGTFHSYILRGFLKFDVSALPANAGQVKVIMHSSALHAVTLSVFQVTSDWTGSTVNYGAQPTFSLIPEASATLLQQPAYYSWDITALYNAWKSGAKPNYGICFRTDEIATDTIGNWDSRHTATPPRLEIIGSSVPFIEVPQTVPPEPGEFAVSYQTGRMRFHPSQAGNSFSVDYRGTGSPVTAENRN
jgi:hypothetical protein